MGDERTRMLEVLRSNRGFREPERWVDYAVRHSFQAVRAEEVTACPDCGAEDGSPLGQYVHYSTLITLVICHSCELIYANKRIDPAIVLAHFESSYKDEEYYQARRQRIFEFVAAWIARNAPPQGSVLDVGGAKGHLMEQVRRRRRDLRITVHDISETACSWASKQYGFETILGDVAALDAKRVEYDLVVLSDVIYYEPEPKLLWNALSRLVKNGGSVILRVPNKLRLIRACQRLREIGISPGEKHPQDRVRFFNPEHLYIFSRRYLEARLSSTGFVDIRTVPSPMLVSKSSRLLCTTLYQIARVVRIASLGRWIATPSLVMTARKPAA